MQRIDPKLAGVAGILLLWFGLILTGQATSGAGADLVSALKDILVWLIGYHAVTSLQPVPKDPAPAPSAEPFELPALTRAPPPMPPVAAIAQEVAPVVATAIAATSPVAAELVDVAKAVAPVVEAVAEQPK
ncbi:hypothetical protein [Paludibacterium purpuratum]|uniref:Uncharacterized protein n=1 Tax=Paludibacterium purpuratum TaxID=1144873 RepID=A0A4R7BC35_9NEIS|nr:hypothetical protein [Paludibacterium purpuratum]TDR82223.1 hypothetical protein DFP86_102337 [Paludibacterium purpuratum]